MPRILFQRSGIWVSRKHGQSERIRLRSLLYPLVAGLILTLVLALTINRETDFFREFTKSIVGIDKQFPHETIETFLSFNRKAVESLLLSNPVARQTEIVSLDLVVGKNALERMYDASVIGDPNLGHEPGSDRPYEKAFYRDESGKVQECEIAYRGATLKHHQASKPSFRVKIKKDDIELGRRYVEIQRPEDVIAACNWLPSRLAMKMGIFTDHIDPVRLFINGMYYGMYERRYRPGESLAIANDRMPGTFFKGDLVGRKQGLASLWDSSSHWRYFGELGPESIEVFEDFLRRLKLPPNSQSIEGIDQILNLEAYARFEALNAATLSVHVDESHNQLFYFSSNAGKLEPVVWDPNAYVSGNAEYPINVIRHPVVGLLTRDPRWVHARNKFLFHFILEEVAASIQISLLNEYYERTRTELQGDVNLSHMGQRRSPRDLLSQKETYNRLMKSREAYIKDFLSDTRFQAQAVLDEQPPRTRFQVFGNTAIQVKRRDGSPVTCMINGTRFQQSTALLYPGLSESFPESPTGLWSDQPDKAFAVPRPLEYEILGSIEEFIVTDGLSNRPVTSVEGQPPALNNNDLRTIHPWNFGSKDPSEVVLGPGIVELRTDLHVLPEQALIIKPGTELRLSKGVGVYSEGLTLIRGTRDAPIKILPHEPGKPWAAIGIHGKHTKGSEITWLECSGGSIGRLRHIHFKGMFNVYHCPDLTMKHCSFGRNAIGDDTVNLAESKCHVEECKWEAALSDGLDLDLVEGRVRNCSFFNAGGDAIDLMSSKVEIEGCEMIGSGDKGISVGEGTIAFVRDCVMADCAIGIELKDGSRAVVVRTLFNKNATAVHGYRKKWLYRDGGLCWLHSCELQNNGVDLNPEPRALVLHSNTRVLSSSEQGLRVIDMNRAADIARIPDSLNSPFFTNKLSWKAASN